MDDADEWSAEGVSRVSGLNSEQYEGRFWQESYNGGEHHHQQQHETNGEASVVFANGNTFSKSKSSFKFSNNVGSLGSKKSSSSSFDQAGRHQLARRPHEATGGHSCILFIQMELCSSTLR